MDEANQTSSVQENQTTISIQKPKNKLSYIIILLLIILVFSLGGYLIFLLQKRSEIVRTRPILTAVKQSQSVRIIPSISTIQIVKPTIVTRPTVLEEATNWQTYINKKYGYVLKYKPTSKLKQFSCSSQALFGKGDDIFVLDEITSTFPECGRGGYGWPISIIIGIDAQAVAPNTCNATESWKAQESKVEIGGIVGKKCHEEFIGKRLYEGPDEKDWITFKQNSYFFRLELNNKQYIETFNQIVSTFKFQ